MLELAIMIEGQNGLNWARWMRIAGAVEDLDDLDRLEAMAPILLVKQTAWFSTRLWAN